jgi:ribosome biogenesis GTPase
VKKKKLEKKKRRRVRTRNWEKNDQHEFSFTHDRVKHRRAQVKLSRSAEDQNPLPTEFTPNAIVIAHSKKWAFVTLEGEEQLCIVDERLREDDATLLAPGDQVLVEWEGDEAIVRGVAPRRTRLCRPGGEGARIAEQVLAANVDILILVTAAAEPPFRPGLVDRYLIAAEVGGVEPVLCVNKMDLVDDPPAELQIYRELGVRIVLTSCEKDTGLDELRDVLRGKLSVLSGHSGVGKSTLLNHLDPDLRIKTQTTSESTGKGRHTTTAARLYELSDDICIIDTPGIRALGLWQISPEEVAYYFPEIAEAGQACKFRDCTHTHEPQCGVRAAVESGELSALRYDSYLRIRASLESDEGLTPGRIATTWHAHSQFGQEG